MAKAYRALCTPEFMVFDSKLELQYHGQFDSARPSKDVSVTGEAILHWFPLYTSAVAVVQCPLMSGCILAVSKDSMPFCSLNIRSLLRLLDLLPFVL